MIDNEDINVDNLIVTETQAKKRGRKPKLQIEKVINDESCNDMPIEIKKRGRKPSCKILNKSDIYNMVQEKVNDCLIIHLPITEKEIKSLENNNSKINNDIKNDKKINLFEIDEKNIEIKEDTNNNICHNCVHYQEKLEKLEKKYSINNLVNNDKIIHNIAIKLENIYNKEDIWDKQNDVCCWWCCNKFDTLPLGLPEKYYEKKFHVMGIFCSFNCAMAYNLSLSDNKIWDRISLLYHLRNIIFLSINPPGLLPNNDIKLLDNIIIAPPRCMLKMFGGSLTIDEFREKSIILKKQFRSIIPPTITLTQQIEESTYCIDQNILIKQNKSKNFNNIMGGLVLKRTKPTINKSSLMQLMKIQYSEI